MMSRHFKKLLSISPIMANGMMWYSLFKDNIPMFFFFMAVEIDEIQEGVHEVGKQRLGIDTILPDLD